MRRSLTDKQIAKLKPGAKRQTIADPNCRGLYVRVTPAGGKSFAVVARDQNGTQVWTTLGTTELMSIEEARDQARDEIKRIKKEGKRDKPDSFKTVAENFFKRHVEARNLISKDEIRRQLEVYIYPKWGNREFVSIKRSDITALMDEIEDERGARMADFVLATIRMICNSYEIRHGDDDYRSPVTRGMTRYDAKKSARSRILDDAEIRLVWRVAETSGKYGALVRLALLTGQRAAKLAQMKWPDIDGDIWNVPSNEREKGTGGALVLPPKAIAIIRAQKKIVGNDFVFPGRNAGFNGFSPSKRKFDERIATALREKAAERGEDPDKAKMAPWVFHDLRRTSRSLMSRAGLQREIAERVLGHVIPGVEGVYDRHRYVDEKADALKRLAGLIDKILNPPKDNVVDLEQASRV